MSRTLQIEEPLVSTDLPKHEFWTRLASELTADCFRYHDDNLDEIRFGNSFSGRVRDYGLRLARKLGFYRAPLMKASAFSLTGLSDTYDFLEEDNKWGAP